MAKFYYASWFGAGSKLVRSDSVMEFGFEAASNQLRTSYCNGIWLLLHGTLVAGVSQLCGVEQRAPPIFGRAPSRWALAYILVANEATTITKFVHCFFLQLYA